MKAIDARELTQLFGRTIRALRESGYAWEPMIPDRLVECRRHPEAFDALTRFFGLGGEAAEKVADAELVAAGIAASDLVALHALMPAFSRIYDHFIAHTHWPHHFRDGVGPHHSEGVYAGRESFELARRLAAAEGAFEGKRVLDLGSGSGAISISLASRAREILGIECSSEAVLWSNAAADAQGLSHLRFARGAIGQPECEALVAGGKFDAAVFNPPFAIPSGAPRPVRDGGALGIELPLKFVDFARDAMEPGGRAYCFVTNPIVDGRAAFFDRLDTGQWEIAARELINDRFNQSIYRKEGYARLGIERVELWYLQLRAR